MAYLPARPLDLGACSLPIWETWQTRTAVPSLLWGSLPRFSISPPFSLIASLSPQFSPGFTLHPRFFSLMHFLFLKTHFFEQLYRVGFPGPFPFSQPKMAETQKAPPSISPIAHDPLIHGSGPSLSLVFWLMHASDLSKGEGIRCSLFLTCTLIGFLEWLQMRWNDS